MGYKRKIIIIKIDIVSIFFKAIIKILTLFVFFCCKQYKIYVKIYIRIYFFK